MERLHWKTRWISLVVQRLRFNAANTAGESSIPGWGAKILHAVWHSQKIKREKKCKKIRCTYKDMCKRRKFVILKIECAYKDHCSNPLSLFPQLATWQLIRPMRFLPGPRPTWGTVLWHSSVSQPKVSGHPPRASKPRPSIRRQWNAPGLAPGMW